MEEMKNQESGRTVFKGLSLDEERALYGISNADVVDCRFDGPADGESALKEASLVNVSGCFMNLRYPFWHLSSSKIADCILTEKCRAALWYDKDVEIEGCRLGGIKALHPEESMEGFRADWFDKLYGGTSTREYFERSAFSEMFANWIEGQESYIKTRISIY